MQHILFIYEILNSLFSTLSLVGTLKTNNCELNKIVSELFHSEAVC